MADDTASEQAAILELKGSHFAVEGIAGALTLRLFPDRVETTQRVGLHHQNRVVPLEHVTAIGVRPGKGSWETLVITTDSGDPIEVPGLATSVIADAIAAIEAASKAATDEHEGAALLDELAGAEEEEAPSVGDRLRHLNLLRADGTISEEEFSRRKAELFAT